MPTSLTEFISLLGGGTVTLAGDIGEGLVSMAKSAFFKVDESGAIQGINEFAGVIAIGGGIALAIGLTTKVVSYIFNIG